MVKQPGFKSWWGHDASFVMFCAPCGSCAMVTVWHFSCRTAMYGRGLCCQFTKGLHIRTQPCQPAEKNLTSLHSTLPFVHPWLPSSFLGSFVTLGCNITREDSNSVGTCDHTIYHNITLFGQPWKR